MHHLIDTDNHELRYRLDSLCLIYAEVPVCDLRIFKALEDGTQKTVFRE